MKSLAEIELNQATATTVAASTVFAHAVCEGVLIHLCQLTARLDPAAWYPRIRFKKVSVEDLDDRTPEEIKGELLEKHLSALEKQSLLDKVDALMSVLQPETTSEILPNFHYKQDKLEKIDEFRHGCAHNPNLAEPECSLTEMDEMVSYLLNVARMLVELTRDKYSIDDIGPSEDDRAVFEDNEMIMT